MTTALTLRLDDAVYEAVRQEAFDRRVPISAIIRDALIAHLDEQTKAAHPARFCDANGCTAAHNDHVTAGGFHFCDAHAVTLDDAEALILAAPDHQAGHDKACEADWGPEGQESPCMCAERAHQAEAPSDGTEFIDTLNRVWHHRLDVLGAARDIAALAAHPVVDDGTIVDVGESRRRACSCWRLRPDGSHGKGCDFHESGGSS